MESRIISNKESGYLGVSPTIENQKMGIIDSISATTLVEIDMTKAAVEGIFTLFSPQNLQTLLGT